MNSHRSHIAVGYTVGNKLCIKVENCKQHLQTPCLVEEVCPLPRIVKLTFAGSEGEYLHFLHQWCSDGKTGDNRDGRRGKRVVDRD